MLGGDARELSVRTCFPRLWYNEQRFRSVFLGSMLSTFAAYRRRSWLSLDLLNPLLQRISTGGRCYTLRGGLATLVLRLRERLAQPAAGVRPVEFLEDAEGTRFEPVAAATADAALGGQVQVQLSSGRVLHADAVVAAVPPDVLRDLLNKSSMSDQLAPSGASV